MGWPGDIWVEVWQWEPVPPKYVGGWNRGKRVPGGWTSKCEGPEVGTSSSSFRSCGWRLWVPKGRYMAQSLNKKQDWMWRTIHVTRGKRLTSLPVHPRASKLSREVTWSAIYFTFFIFVVSKTQLSLLLQGLPPKLLLYTLFACQTLCSHWACMQISPPLRSLPCPPHGAHPLSATPFPCSRASSNSVCTHIHCYYLLTCVSLVKGLGQGRGLIDFAKGQQSG